MGSDGIKRVASAGALLSGLALLVGTPAVAGCKMPGDPMGPAVMAGYTTKPAAVLIEHPLGDTALDILAAQLAVSGGDSLTALMSVVADASNKQRTAIGEGLAAAANTCQKQDSGVVQRIISAVKRSGSAAVQRAFTINYDTGPSASAASGSPSSSIKTSPALPQQLTLPSINTNTPKLPDPFGPPDGWR